MRSVPRAALALLATALAGGCAHDPPRPPGPPELVVVVPDRDGRVGTVVVTDARGSTTLDRPFAAARVDAAGKAEARTVTEAEVKKVFSDAIAAQPLRPVSFLLYFEEGTDEYTPESKKAFDGVFAEIARRKAAEIAVIGHTDRVGRVDFNDALSLKRAERVRRDFVDRGIPSQSIGVAGRGEREPIVLTADEVPEPRNRRVEISVR